MKKEKLQNAVETVIGNYSKIHRDSSRYNVVVVDGGKKDTLWDNYYNDTNTYVTIFIENNSALNEYTFRYAGSKNNWDTSQTSNISIAYAYDSKRRGGSAGNGGVGWYDFKLKNELTRLFEQEFISKIDSILGMNHTEE